MADQIKCGVGVLAAPAAHLRVERGGGTRERLACLAAAIGWRVARVAEGFDGANAEGDAQPALAGVWIVLKRLIQPIAQPRRAGIAVAKRCQGASAGVLDGVF